MQESSYSGYVPPSVLKEDIPFPTSTALDDLKLLQPTELISQKAQCADSWLTEIISYILFGEKQSSLCHLSSEVKNWVLNVSKHCNQVANLRIN